MKAKIITEPAKVYSTTDANSFPLTELMIGSEVELGNVKKAKGLSWVAVTLPNGEKGFLPGTTKVFTMKQATLLQDANLYSEPSTFSVVKSQYKKNSKLVMTDIISQNGESWVKVRDAKTGAEGYLDGKTRITSAPVVTKATGKRNMLFGALWCIGGIVVTFGSMAAASSGGTYYITWGAILFGGIQFVQGLIQYMSSPD